MVLHEREIRKSQPPFDFLLDARRRQPFLDDLTSLVANAPFRLIASIIQKQAHRQRYSAPMSPYHLALEFNLERAHRFLIESEAAPGVCHVIAESRGAKEDADLALQFDRICKGHNWLRDRFPFELVLVDKRANSSGLQLADLCARPVGLSVLRPGQPNRAFDTLGPKLLRNRKGTPDGVGLKVFPKP